MIPCFYHPTTAIIVDDNEKFLKSMARLLTTMDPHIKIKTFSDPDEALSYVNEVKSLPTKLLPSFDSDESLPSSGKIQLEHDISNIYKQATQRKVFDEVSVAVVDYSMPNRMTGGDFCESILGTNIKSIMLTGEADAELGVSLLNDRIINKFLVKGHHDLEEKLASSIIDMKRAYFQDLSSSVLKDLTPGVCPNLADPDFINFFNGLCKDLNILSYYMIELSGSFLLVNDEGKLFWLIVKTKKDIDEYVNFMRTADEISENTISIIERGEKIPYFHSEQEHIYSIDSDFPLEKHLYPAKKLEGQVDYYYSLTDAIYKFPLDKAEMFKKAA
jgi:FixJ family two-component response regulator